MLSFWLGAGLMAAFLFWTEMRQEGMPIKEGIVGAVSLILFWPLLLVWSYVSYKFNKE